MSNKLLVHPRTAFDVPKIDYFKKRQFFAALKRITVQSDWRYFKNEIDRHSRTTTTSVSGQPVLNFETVMWKLKNDLYETTDQFASDVRILLSNATVLNRVSHEIHKIAMKFGELFDMMWKSLEAKWAAEKEKSKPMEKVSCKVSKKRKLSMFEIGNEENKCPNSGRQAATKVNQHLLDTILASQSSLFSCNNDGFQRKKQMEGCNNGEMQRKKQREAARVKIQEMKRTVFIEDNLNSVKELEELCGISLESCNKVNPLKEIIGLVQKD